MAAFDGYRAAKQFRTQDGGVGMLCTVAARYEMPSIHSRFDARDPVCNKMTIPCKNCDFAYLDFTNASALDANHVAGPNRGRHACSSHPHPHPPVRADNVRRQGAGHVGRAIHRDLRRSGVRTVSG